MRNGVQIDTFQIAGNTNAVTGSSSVSVTVADGDLLRIEVTAASLGTVQRTVSAGYIDITPT